MSNVDLYTKPTAVRSIFSAMLAYIWTIESIFPGMSMSQGGAGRRGFMEEEGTAAETSQQLSHLARPLDHHAQGTNMQFGVITHFDLTRKRENMH